MNYQFDENRHKSLQQELDRVVSQLRHAYNPEKIIIFGSFAQGKTQQWSDLDIAIIMHTKKRFIDRLMSVAHLIHPRLGTDIVVYTPEEFQVMERDNYFVRDEIVGRGKVVYDKTQPL